MSHVYILSFENRVDMADECVTSRIDQFVEAEFPPIKGWTRSVTKGGMLSNDGVTYSRETADFAGTIVVFLSIRQTSEATIRVSYDVTAVLTEKLHGDDRYYSFDGSFLNGLRTVLDARVALKKLADERRAIRRDFV